MLQVENLNVYYGNIHAVKNISFSVDTGEIVTLIGANGAGKSTLLNAIAGRASSMQGEDDYWKFWKDENKFPTEVTKDIFIDTEGKPGKNGGNPKLEFGEKEYVVKDYLGIGKNAGGRNRMSGVVNIKYKLVIKPVDTSRFGWRLYRAILYVSDNEYADVVDTGAVFVTYMFYFGEVPEPAEES